ncbi:hypothetical protein [Pseudomonas benzenivorans]|uniref:Uncharacterized protein n=1 Tax=Pseudomonas benzenivorans TaxID=556533 RepID=A0ABY5H1B8_9PSED|nr:hypothetical protein [Pseudomonas benzenivorans]UTW06060.1 hypothetical protein KDW96_12750 [Pseudomonas benzenivorans]
MMLLFDCPERALRLANHLLGGGLALLLAGLFGALFLRHLAGPFCQPRGDGQPD